jgi:hypothetical protein
MKPPNDEDYLDDKWRLMWAFCCSEDRELRAEEIETGKTHEAWQLYHAINLWNLRDRLRTWFRGCLCDFCSRQRAMW